jgi:hypothetical protein
MIVVLTEMSFAAESAEVMRAPRASFVTGATWNVDGGLSARFAT